MRKKTRRERACEMPVLGESGARQGKREVVGSRLLVERGSFAILLFAANVSLDSAPIERRRW